MQGLEPNPFQTLVILDTCVLLFFYMVYLRRSQVPFKPSMACQVVVTLDLNKKSKFKKILPGSVWEHTVGVCSAVERASQSTLASNSTFKSLMRSNLKTPIKELIKQMPFHCDVNKVTRARQEFIRKQVGGATVVGNLLWMLS